MTCPTRKANWEGRALVELDAAVLPLWFSRVRTKDRWSTRGQRGAGHAEVAIVPEPRTDIEVNGPYWNDHFVDVVPESDVEDETHAPSNPSCDPQGT